ncbi:MAG: PDZ domain-containing protein [Bacillota bacterium]
MYFTKRDTSTSVYIEAPIETIWVFLSSAEGWNQYLSDIAKTDEKMGEFKQGDHIELIIGELTNRSICTEIKKPSLLKMHDHYEALFPDGTVWKYELYTTFKLKQVEDMVKVTVTVDGFQDDEMFQWVREGTEVGWRQSLLNLKCIIELGLDLRNFIFGYPRIGVFNYTVSEGNYLKEVFKNGPADIAGLMAGDIITHIDDKPVPDYYTFVKTLSHLFRQKNEVKINFLRNRLACTAYVKLSYEDRFTGLIDPVETPLSEIAVQRQLQTNHEI